MMCYTTCNAKTRAGGRCQKLPMANGRCKLHGGKSLSGPAHPNYKHGRYAKKPRAATSLLDDPLIALLMKKR